MRAAFTETLRQVLDQAQQEARQLNQEFVGTEHLMLGVLHCQTCEATRSLRLSQSQPERVRSVLLAQLPRGKQPPVITGDLPLSPKSQRVINTAIVKANLLTEPTISTRMLLLALLEEPETTSAQALRTCGADLDALRHQLPLRPEEKEN